MKILLKIPFALLMFIKLAQSMENVVMEPEWTWPPAYVNSEGKCFCPDENECKKVGNRNVCPPPICQNDDDCFPYDCLRHSGHCAPIPFKEENEHCEKHFECGEGKLCNGKNKCQQIPAHYSFWLHATRKCAVNGNSGCEQFENCVPDPNKATGICLIKTLNINAKNWLEKLMEEEKGKNAGAIVLHEENKKPKQPKMGHSPHFPPNQISPHLRLTWHSKMK